MKRPIEILHYTSNGAKLVCDADSGLLLTYLVHYILKIGEFGRKSVNIGHNPQPPGYPLGGYREEQ